MPDEYNFFLGFDGSRVTIFKDGREIDVYGDGYYDDASLWDVPGYENYAVSEDLKKASVYMAVRRAPEKYYESRSVYGYDREVSEWYRLWERHAQNKEMFLADIAGVCAGIVLFLAYLPPALLVTAAHGAVKGGDYNSPGAVAPDSELAQMARDLEEIRQGMESAVAQQEVLIEGDGAKLYRVFQNLIQNALKYSLEGSGVYITLWADAGWGFP